MIVLSSIITMFGFRAECSGASSYMTFVYNKHYFYDGILKAAMTIQQLRHKIF